MIYIGPKIVFSRKGHVRDPRGVSDAIQDLDQGTNYKLYKSIRHRRH